MGRRGADLKVGFVDAEGQGDRDSAYDARIACPVLLAAKCVIFIWKDSLQKDRMLDLLGVMTRAAASVDVAGGSGGAASRPFGHLHIVFRDWNYDDDGDKAAAARKVKETLLGVEAEGGGEDAAKRNSVRGALATAFESVSVWLLPPPTERTKDLKKILSEDLLSSEFNAEVKALRGSLCAQLGAGPRGWAGQPLTVKTTP